MTPAEFDAIRTAYARHLLSQLPHAECETCNYATRSLVAVDGEYMQQYLMKVECQRECEKEDAVTV